MGKGSEVVSASLHLVVLLLCGDGVVAGCDDTSDEGEELICADGVDNDWCRRRVSVRKR